MQRRTTTIVLITAGGLAPPKVTERQDITPDDARSDAADIVDIARSLGCRSRHANRSRRRRPSALSVDDDGFD